MKKIALVGLLLSAMGTAHAIGVAAHVSVAPHVSVPHIAPAPHISAPHISSPVVEHSAPAPHVSSAPKPVVAPIILHPASHCDKDKQDCN